MEREYPLDFLTPSQELEFERIQNSQGTKSIADIEHNHPAMESNQVHDPTDTNEILSSIAGNLEQSVDDEGQELKNMLNETRSNAIEIPTEELDELYKSYTRTRSMEISRNDTEDFDSN